MGEKQVFQELTREDRITVFLYRVGIVLSALIVAALACLLKTTGADGGAQHDADALLFALYVSVGMSVFFIHLYIGKLKVFLNALYIVSLASLALLLFLGKGSPSAAFLRMPFSLVLLLPLSGCLGFITAKEAFCFRLFEGYLLALIMPLCILLASAGILSFPAAVSGLILIAAMLVFFTFRKVFMPLGYDIGDKSAYR